MLAKTTKLNGERYTAIGNGFYNAGEVPFESVTEASADACIYPKPAMSIPVHLNHVYVVKTLGGKYAKFIVRRIAPGLSLSSDGQATPFIFTLPDGTTTNDVIVSITSDMPGAPQGGRQIARLLPESDGSFREVLSPTANLIRVRTTDGEFGVNRYIVGEERLQPISFALEPAVVGTVRFVEKETGNPIVGRRIAYYPRRAISDNPSRWLLISSVRSQTDEDGVVTLTMYVGGDYLMNDFTNPTENPTLRLPHIHFSPQRAGETIDRGTIEVE